MHRSRTNTPREFISGFATGAVAMLRSAVPTPTRRTARRALRGAVDAMPPLARARDARLLRQRMRAALGYDPDFLTPRTHNERIAHKILYDRDPLLVRTADKIAVRGYVIERIGADYLIPLIGTYDRTADIEWETLPNRFVLKANHGSGTNLIVRDRAATDRATVLRQANRWLAENHYAWTGEWAYSRIRPRLLVEQMLVGVGGAAPEDYKFHVFRGRPRVLEVHLGRFSGDHRHLLRDVETLGPVPFRWGSRSASWAEEAIYRPPAEARAMAEIAARLGAGFDHVRVDLYLSGGRIWFGELTHYTGNACEPFVPPRYDRILGDLWMEPERGWPEACPLDGR